MNFLKGLWLLLLFSSSLLFAQTRQIDSLRQVVQSIKPACPEPCIKDTVRVNALNSLGKSLLKMGSYDSALKYIDLALPLSQRIGFLSGTAYAYNSLGNIGYFKGNYPEALKFFLDAMRIREKLADKKGIASLYNNIGEVYRLSGDNDRAMENYEKALQLNRYLKDTLSNSFGNILNNIGSVYRMRHKYLEARKMGKLALAIFERVGNRNGVGGYYLNSGSMDHIQHDYNSAYENYEKGLQVFSEIQNLYGMSKAYNGLAEILICHRNSIPLGRKYSFESLKLGKKINDKEGISSTYLHLADADSVEKNYKSGLENYKLYIAYRDSVTNEANTKKMVQADMQYEFDKKEEAARAEQEKRDAVTLAEKKKQQVILWSISGIGLLVLGFAFFAYRSFLQKKKANIEISKQKHIIEEKQKEILDSIYYARRIQQSLLPHEKYIQRKLEQLQNNS